MNTHFASELATSCIASRIDRSRDECSPLLLAVSVGPNG